MFCISKASATKWNLQVNPINANQKDPPDGAAVQYCTCIEDKGFEPLYHQKITCITHNL